MWTRLMKKSVLKHFLPGGQLQFWVPFCTYPLGLSGGPTQTPPHSAPKHCLVLFCNWETQSYGPHMTHEDQSPFTVNQRIRNKKKFAIIFFSFLSCHLFIERHELAVLQKLTVCIYYYHYIPGGQIQVWFSFWTSPSAPSGGLSHTPPCIAPTHCFVLVWSWFR